PCENIDRQTRTPGDDREKAPALRQPFWSGLPCLVEWQVPSAAQGDAVADVLIARSAEQARVIRRHLRVSLLETRNIIDRVCQGIGQSEVSSPEETAMRNLLGQAGLQAVIAGLGEIPEFRYAGKTAGRVRIHARTGVAAAIDTA